MLPNVKVDSSKDFDRQFAAQMALLGLSGCSVFITALSGGADSTALALLAQRYAEKNGKSHYGVIVDHGLREDSDLEAERVKTRLEYRGVHCRILRIDTPKPITAVQEWARGHRHRLLADAARTSGAVVLFGHHAGDLAETVAMRLERGSGLFGLAGIPARRQHGDVVFARPLLPWSAIVLRQVCAVLDCKFELDPSNDSLVFERVRIRRSLERLDQKMVGRDVGSANLVRLARAAGCLTTVLDRAVEPLIRNSFIFYEAGYARFKPSQLLNLSQPVWWHIMRRIIAALGGQDYAPSKDAGIECRRRISHGLSATLGGCHFHPNHMVGSGASHYQYTLFRETGRKLIAQPIAEGATNIFAGCWLVKSQVSGTVHAFGDKDKILKVDTNYFDQDAMPDSWHKLPHRARQAIPVVTDLDGRLFYPHLGRTTHRQGDVCLSACHLGIAEPPIFFADRWTG
jgi:tRNA(Ile)-lysidine synthase